MDDFQVRQIAYVVASIAVRAAVDDEDAMWADPDDARRVKEVLKQISLDLTAESRQPEVEHVH